MELKSKPRKYDLNTLSTTLNLPALGKEGISSALLIQDPCYVLIQTCRVLARNWEVNVNEDTCLALLYMPAT